jgi:hypothetical protein
MCQLNSPNANHKVSASKEKTEKQGNLHNNNNNNMIAMITFGEE